MVKIYQFPFFFHQSNVNGGILLVTINCPMLGWELSPGFLQSAVMHCLPYSDQRSTADSRTEGTLKC